MSEYKIVYRADHSGAGNVHEIEWEQGCPLIFDVFQVSRNIETGEAFLQAKVRNICGETIDAFAASFQCNYKDGSAETLTVKPLDADIMTGCYYSIQPVELSQGDIESVSALICSASLPSGEWASASCPLEYPARTELGICEDALVERALQLKERGCGHSSSAALFPIEEHSGWTLCACGQPNVNSNRCVECGLDLSDVPKELDDEDWLKHSAAERFRMEEELEAERLSKLEAQRKRFKLIATPCIAVFALLFGLWWVFIAVPQDASRNALEAFERENDLVTYDEYVSLEDWERKAEKWDDDYRALVDRHYENMSQDDKEELLQLKAERCAIESIYEDIDDSWSIDPPKLRIRMSLQSLSWSSDSSHPDTYQIEIKTRDRAEWDDEDGELGVIGSTFESTYRAWYEIDISNCAVTELEFEQTNADIFGY